MPTYQYACTECGEQLEVQQRFTDEPLTTCPMCEGRLRKVFDAVGVVFKGSGFYRTDSRAVPADGKAETKTDAKAGAKSDAGTTAANGTGKGAAASGDAAGKGSTTDTSKGKTATPS